MNNSVINTKNAPAAIGPYSQGLKVGNFIFTSGQIPIDPNTSKLVTEDIVKATRQSMENVKAILEAAGSNFSKVVKVVIYVKDLKDFSKINEVYGEYFTDNKPARSCVEVSNLPKDALIEIEAIATL